MMECVYQYGKGKVICKHWSWCLIENIKTKRQSWHLEYYVKIKL